MNAAEVPRSSISALTMSLLQHLTTMRDEGLITPDTHIQKQSDIIFRN